MKKYPADIDEMELSAGMARGLREAREQVYHIFGPMVMSICRRYAESYDDASDMLQDSFISVFSSARRYRWQGEGSLGAWIRQIAVRECIRNLKRRSAVVPIEEWIEANISETAEDPPPDNLCAEQILGCIEKLPDAYRVVFNLFYFENLPHSEIADILGITEGNSMARLSRAKRMLREIITKKYGNR